MIFLEYVGSRACLSATVNGCIPEECGFFCAGAPQARLQGRSASQGVGGCPAHICLKKSVFTKSGCPKIITFAQMF